MSLELAERIQSVRFTPVRLREGYDMGEVDTFLDRLEAGALSGVPLRPLVEAVLFTPVRLREGYDMAEVDQFLEDVVAAQESAGSTGAAEPARQPRRDPTAESGQSPPGYPSVIEERPGLMSRLFGRK